MEDWENQVKLLEQRERNLSALIAEEERQLQAVRKRQRLLVEEKKRVTKRKLRLQEANMEITTVVKKKKFDPITARGLAFLASLKGGKDEKM